MVFNMLRSNWINLDWRGQNPEKEKHTNAALHRKFSKRSKSPASNLKYFTSSLCHSQRGHKSKNSDSSRDSISAQLDHKRNVLIASSSSVRPACDYFSNAL